MFALFIVGKTPPVFFVVFFPRQSRSVISINFESRFRCQCLQSRVQENISWADEECGVRDWSTRALFEPDGVLSLKYKKTGSRWIVCWRLTATPELEPFTCEFYGRGRCTSVQLLVMKCLQCSPQERDPFTLVRNCETPRIRALFLLLFLSSCSCSSFFPLLTSNAKDPRRDADDPSARALNCDLSH
jgi:hypothetical protein